MAAFFRSAFEKLSLQNQERVVEATEYTAMQVSPQGDLFGIFVEMRNYLKAISEGGVTKLRVDKKSAKALGTSVQGIGAGIKLIAEAMDIMPSGKEAQKKMEAIVTGIDAMKALGGAIFKFAGMLALSLPLLILGIPALLLAVPMVLAVGGMFYLLGKMNITKEIKEVATGLAIAGLAFISLAGSLVLSEMILNHAGDPLKTIAIVSALVLGTSTVMAIAGLFGGLIKKGAVSMLFASLPIIALSLSMAIFTSAVKPDKDGWESIAQVGALVTGLGLLMAGAGAAAMFIIPGAAAMVLAGGALIAISYGLSKMAEVMKPGKLDHLFADSGNATKGVKVLGVTIIEGGRPMSNLEWALLSIARSFMLPPLAIAGMYAGAPALIMSGMALLTIAKGIEKFQALDIDYETLPEQIAKTTTVLATAFAKIGEQYPGGGGGFVSALFGASSDTSVVAQGISAVGGMGRALTGIAKGVQNMANLRFPTKWDKNGNPIEFETLTNEHFDRVTVNTQKIVTALSGTFAAIGANPDAQKSWFLGKSKVTKGISIVNKMMEPLSKLSEFIGTFGEQDVTLKDADESLKNIAGSMGTWTDSINELDIEKVTEVRKLYEGLAGLTANGSSVFEDMSETMIEAIDLLVEKLGEFAGEVKNTTIEATTSVSNATTGPVQSSGAATVVNNNTELVAAMKNLERVLSGTLPVYVTNPSGGL